MKPFDALTQENKEFIKEYSLHYAEAEINDIEQVLRYWNKNKQKLFKMFGNKLEISIPIDMKADVKYYAFKLHNLYKPIPYLNEKGKFFNPTCNKNHLFINDLSIFIQSKMFPILKCDVNDFIDYFKYGAVQDGKTNTEAVFLGGHKKKLVIPEGTKIMRAIRKVLENYDYPHMELFNKWRDDISLINTDKQITEELVFSINPVDFITMSDNESGWTSCMSGKGHGGYSAGTIEMMNSNVAVVAYLKNNDTNFIYNGKKIPNKMWRTLVFVHEDILLVGKHYPYQSDTLANVILDEMQKIAKNIGWKYQYKHQRYQDLIRYYSNEFIRYDLYRSDDHHKIFTYMGIMYHDILEDTDTTYWCCRNWVKKSLFLNLSGPATCMCCGDNMYPDNDFDCATRAEKICDKCQTTIHCESCNKTSLANRGKIYSVPRYSRVRKAPFYCNICKKCLTNEFYYDTISNNFIKKIDLQHMKKVRIPFVEIDYNKKDEQMNFIDEKLGCQIPIFFHYTEGYRNKDCQYIYNYLEELGFKIHGTYRNELYILSTYENITFEKNMSTYTHEMGFVYKGKDKNEGDKFLAETELHLIPTTEEIINETCDIFS